MGEKVDFDAQHFDQLHEMVLNDDPRDLKDALDRWLSLKRSMNDGASLLYVLAAKVTPHWQGETAKQGLARLQNMAKWMQAIGLQADKNAYATEQIHDAVVKAHKQMHALATAPNRARATDLTAKTLLGAATPLDEDSRQPQAATITRQLAWAYEINAPEVREMPWSNDIDRTPSAPPDRGKGEFGDGGSFGSAGTPYVATNNDPTTTVPGSGTPGPTLASAATAPPVPLAETPGVVRPPASAGPVNTLPGGVGVAPNFGGRTFGDLPTGSGQATGGSRTGNNTTGTATTSGKPSGTATGKPGLASVPSGGGVPPNGGAGRPNDNRRRRGKRTDLVEDRGIFDPNRHYAPPVIGIPRQPTLTAAADAPNQHQPAATVERRDENGYPSQIPDHEIANKDGLRIQFKRDRG